MIDFKKGKKGQISSLLLKGDMTIYQAAEIKAAIVEALAKSKKLHLDLEKVEDVDLTFLQLLCSAHRTAVCTEKEIILRGNFSDSLKKMIEDSGLPETISCPFDRNHDCFWLKEVE